MITPISPVLPSSPDAPEIVFAKNQPQYTPLPAVYRRFQTDEGMVTSRWKFSFRERLRMLLTGDLWVQLLTFHSGPQPIKFHTKEPKEY